MKNTTGLQRGKSLGRPKGSQNKATLFIRTTTQKLFDKRYFDAVKTRLAKGELPPAVETKLLAYAFGEPKQAMELTGADGGPIRINHHYVAAAGA